MYENVLYFAASRDFDNKNKIYGKFGNYRVGLEKQRLSAYNTTNPSYKYVALPYNQMIMLKLGKPGQYLDNYINCNVLLKQSSRPMVDFRRVCTRNPFLEAKTDWFSLSEDAAKSIILYMEKRSQTSLENTDDYLLFVHTICNFLQIPCSSDITRDYSSDLNATIGCNLKWDVVPSRGNTVFTIIPHTAICTVNQNHVHSKHKHSYLVITSMHVVAECFCHGKRTVTGAASRRLQKMFFPNELKGSLKDIMHNVIEFCSGASLWRLDGFVWKAKSEKPWTYNKLESYEDFINTYFKSSPRKFLDVIKYMETVDHESFPFIKKDADYIGFDNCVVNIITYDVFDKTNWDDAIAPRHSMKGNFCWNSIETPMFDNLVQYQLGDGDVYMYFLALIGRLFYRVKMFDDFDVVPLIKGNTGTGRNTVLRVVKRMFPLGAVVCGEDFKKEQYSMGVPIVRCSNIHLPYAKTSGSTSQKSVVFKFDKYVLCKDTTLETRIVESELPSIVAKCLRAYKLLLEVVGSTSFWNVCPNYFHENIHEMSEQTDYIHMFLTLPPGDNAYGNKDVYFTKQQGAAMLLQDFKNKFMNYMRFRHPLVKYRWTSDYSSFSRLGYRVACQHICKACGSHAEAGCCANYNPANRSKRYVIENLLG